MAVKQKKGVNRGLHRVGDRSRTHTVHSHNRSKHACFSTLGVNRSTSILWFELENNPRPSWDKLVWTVGGRGEHNQPQ